MRPSEVAAQYIGQTEEWKKISGYKNYWVSSTGRVYTSDYNHTGKPRLIKAFVNHMGYVACNLMQDGIRKRKLVHRLVALAFIPNAKNLPTVNHKDGNKENNHIHNLEWMTPEDNLKHAHKTGLIKQACGEAHYKTKIPTKDVLDIKYMLSKGIQGRLIAKSYNIDERTVSAIKTGRTRKHENI